MSASSLENPVPWGREAWGAGMSHPPLLQAPGLYSQVVPVESGRSGPSRRGLWARAVLAVTVWAGFELVGSLHLTAPGLPWGPGGCL